MERLKDDGILDCLLHFAAKGHNVLLCTNDKQFITRAQVEFPNKSADCGTHILCIVVAIAIFNEVPSVGRCEDDAEYMMCRHRDWMQSNLLY
jgi:hypothetical protein